MYAASFWTLNNQQVKPEMEINLNENRLAELERLPNTASPAVVRELVHRLREAEKDVERYRLLRRGQHWSTVDGIGDTLRGEALDRAIDAVMQPPRVGDCTEVKPS